MAAHCSAKNGCESAACGTADVTPEGHKVKTGASHQFRIEGMDCAGCAATITNALAGVRGVSNASVSLSREILSFDLERPDGAAVVQETVERLGFGVARIGQERPAGREWWRGQKARHLVLCCVLTALAFLVTHLAPALEWGVFSALIAFAAYPIASRAVIAARFGTPFTIQMLMTIAAIGAVLIGEQVEALVVVLLFMVGEFLEGFAAERARAGIRSLGALLPQEAVLWVNGETRKTETARLQVGDVVQIRPGDRIPADGEIREGFANIDESPITGESVPVAKGPGAEVFAGSIAHDAVLQVEVTRAAEDNTIARIIALVEEAQDARSPTDRFIERFSKVYIPFIVALAVLVAILPPLAGFGPWDTWIYRALALLLIGCPCALVISVPAAIAASLATGARNGILVKGGAVMEEIARVETVVFDKTGTLTEGSPVVTDLVALDGEADAFLALAAGVEQGASHPLAEAICREARSREITPRDVRDIRIVPGKGVTGQAGSAQVFLGAPRYAGEHAALSADVRSRIAALEDQGKTVAVAVLGDRVIGYVALRDEPRDTTKAGLAALRALGTDAVMMTGDNARTAAAIAEDLGIDAQAQMLPEDKARALRTRAQQGIVLMVGDGVNDAPALAEAQVGVAMGSGTDVAMETADAAIMRNDIGDVARMLRLARGTMTNIRQNVAIALGLKAIFLVTTMTGISGLWMAILADTGATLIVTLNAMRLLTFFGRPNRRAPAPQPDAVGTLNAIRP